MGVIMAIGQIASFVFGHRNYSTKLTGIYRNWRNSRVTCKKGSTRARVAKPKIHWTEEQSQVISAVSGGKSVFITGSAGTGKTFLVEHVIKLLWKMVGKSNVYVTASTGIAACALRGQTVHSFAGMKYGAEDWESFLSGILGDKRAMYRWKKVKALVVDEISLIDSDFFSNLEHVAREIREIDKPWGGIQLVVTGDFFQLPPVSVKEYGSRDKKFAFKASCWNSSFDMQIELRKVFRQSDERLVKVLHGVRKGEVDDEDLEFLKQNCCTNEPDNSVVRLFPRNDQVNAVNQERIKELHRDGYRFLAVDTGEDRWKKQLKHAMAPDEVFLCEEARVMLIKNKNTWKGLVNGAVGTVVGFVKSAIALDVCPDGVLPIVKFDSGREIVVLPETWCVMDGDKTVARRKQIPLLLAWALSIHKCQGMTLDRLHTDLSKAFGYGMVYVALSRARNLSGLHLSGFDPSKIKAHPEVLEFYDSLAKRQDEDPANDGETKPDGDDPSKSEPMISSESKKEMVKLHFSLSEFLLSRQRSSSR